MNDSEITITDKKITAVKLKELCKRWFDDMVKVVVDVEKEVIAIGGELHADAEALLLEAGSQQEHLWGANFYPWHPPDQRIDFTALINIRPHQNNPSLEILDETIQFKLREIIEQLILSPGEKVG